MGHGQAQVSPSQEIHMSISGLHRKNLQDLESLTLTTQPFKTLKFFTLAVNQYFKRVILYLLAKGGWLMLLSTVAVALGVLLMTVDGPHEKHVEELLQYFRFGLWWTALGVASSIGLGSGLHTFVLYLGPHIALFTIKAIQCGRVDIKSAPYDTIQLKRGPSWLDKDCSEFGLPLFTSSHAPQIPISSILPQVQVEAILWGIGTALGELPPYFISRAAHLSGSKVDPMEELDVSSAGDSGVIATRLRQIKCWLLSHSQYLNFFTILVLASVSLDFILYFFVFVDKARQSVASYFGPSTILAKWEAWCTQDAISYNKRISHFVMTKNSHFHPTIQTGFLTFSGLGIVSR